ncbi:neuronal acetylcholine receptor subunit beta-4 [Lucilia sericata]|uniref:neuronal acetylcholine receptor subunit beta-4 n=1 Tax=Lucilia sericata TaxID=13632 RepID=UPI0018A81ECB|nr:neuronal acetylcholine receptor subunit beta-4 [Lucilia sericata]
MCHWFYHLLVGIVLFYINGVKADFKYNVSLAQMHTCRHYSIPNNRGYSYADFFHIPQLNNNKLAKTELLHLKFYVMTARDAHILLAVNERPKLMDRVYEIVIGAGRNQFSTIRTSMGRRRVATNQEPNILSMLDPTPIEIIQTKDASLLVYIPGYKEEPLLNFTDASPLNINYISFTTYDNIPASWFFDCQFDGFSNELEEVVRPLSPYQYLLANITSKAENASFPPTLNSIDFSFNIASIRYQHDHGFLQSRLNVILNWQDPRIQWKPENFSFIDTIQYNEYDIWMPHLMVINAAGKSHRIFDFYHEVRIESNGSITLNFPDAILTTWCVNAEENWPNEHLKCEIEFGLESGPLEKLPLIYKDKMPHDNVDSLSEWHLHRISVNPIVKGMIARFTDKDIIQSMDGDISIIFEISRNSTFYKNVFSVPILACQILIILSFLLRGYRRGALILVVILILMLGLMFITKHAPTPYVPNIMIAYQHILRIATFCYMLHIALMWLELYPPKTKPHDWLMSAVNFSPLRLFLCMRLADSNDFIEVQQHPWKEIAKTLNALCFVIVNIILILTVVILLPHA